MGKRIIIKENSLKKLIYESLLCALNESSTRRPNSLLEFNYIDTNSVPRISNGSVRARTVDNEPLDGGYDQNIERYENKKNRVVTDKCRYLTVFRYPTQQGNDYYEIKGVNMRYATFYDDETYAPANVGEIPFQINFVVNRQMYYMSGRLDTDTGKIVKIFFNKPNLENGKTLTFDSCQEFDETFS